MGLLGYELLLRFLWGWFFCLSFIRRQESSERFVKIAFWIGGGVAVCAAWLRLSVPEAQSSLICLGLICLGGGLYCFGLQRIFRTSGWILFVFSPFLIFSPIKFASALNFFSGAFLIGTAFVGQYLGHWYLRVPGMHIRELKRLVHLFFAALGLKSAEILITLARVARDPLLQGIDEMGRPLGLQGLGSAGLSQFNPAQSMLGLQGDSFLGLGSFGLLILGTRLLWGIMAPLILCILIQKTVKMRSTQSATGIYYAVCVMILVGEGTALYLRNGLGWYL